MSVDIPELLNRVERALDDSCAAKAAGLIRDPKAHLVDGSPTSEEIQSLLPTLRARLASSLHTGKRIYGLEQTIACLTKMSPTAVVIGYGFISPKAAGKIYLSRDDEQVLGATIVDRDGTPAATRG
jgi:hypothetical protein